MYPVEDREIKNSIIWNWNEKEMSDSIKNQLIELSEVFKFFEIGFHEKTGWFAIFPSSDVYTDLKEYIIWSELQGFNPQYSKKDSFPPKIETESIKSFTRYDALKINKPEEKSKPISIKRKIQYSPGET